jgi:hypothetical protein
MLFRLSHCAILAVLLCVTPAWGTEILAEDGVRRIVTGDAIVARTRGLDERPKPRAMSSVNLANLLRACEIDEPAAYADSLAEGLQRWGWSQIEQEPTMGSRFLKLRVVHRGGALHAERFDF